MIYPIPDLPDVNFNSVLRLRHLSMHVEHGDPYFYLNLGDGYAHHQNASSVRKYTNIHPFERITLRITVYDLGISYFIASVCLAFVTVFPN